MSTHKATPQRLEEQLRAFYAKLPRRESGYLTKTGRDAWIGWLRVQGLTEPRARQIVKMQENKRQPFNPKHAEKCIDYLRRHGYSVTPPSSEPGTP